jgi:hypothetical protein
MKLAVVVTAAALGVAFGATSSQASTPSPIVFAADRAPTVTGEIWRLDPNGHRVDLSKSPYQDIAPAVSWDGKHVAFLSERSGTTSLYEVGIDGRGLKRLGLTVASVYDAGCDPQLGWQPHGHTLAVMACGGLAGSLWIGRPGQKPVLLLHSKTGLQQGFSWSAQGLLALSTPSGTAVYDASGQLRWRERLAADSRPVWSPGGGLLGLLAGKSTVVVTASGQALIRKNTGRGSLAWVDDRRLAIGGDFGRCCEVKILDVQTGAVTTAKAANFFSPRSADEKLAIVVPHSKTGSFRIGVAPPAGGKTRTYGSVPGCLRDGTFEASPGSLQFAGHSIVYESWYQCASPFDNLYSVAPGGGRIHRLTAVQAQETQPILSPDGSETAYVWAQGHGDCGGCSDGIRIASVDGQAIRTLTNPENCTFDDWPTWSPDGTTILYSETGCDADTNPGELYTVSAAGGTPHDLGVAGIEPAWGPTSIAYVGATKASAGLWTANPDGSDPVLVSKLGSFPAWSPDGRLAYLTGGFFNRVLVVGSKHVKLPFARVQWLAWTRDGTRLVLDAMKANGASLDVYTIKPDGTDPQRLTRNYGAAGTLFSGAYN